MTSDETRPIADSILDLKVDYPGIPVLVTANVKDQQVTLKIGRGKRNVEIRLKPVDAPDASTRELVLDAARWAGWEP